MDKHSAAVDERIKFIKITSAKQTALFEVVDDALAEKLETAIPRYTPSLRKFIVDKDDLDAVVDQLKDTASEYGIEFNAPQAVAAAKKAFEELYYIGTEYFNIPSAGIRASNAVLVKSQIEAANKCLVNEGLEILYRLQQNWGGSAAVSDAAKALKAKRAAEVESSDKPEAITFLKCDMNGAFGNGRSYFKIHPDSFTSIEQQANIMAVLFDIVPFGLPHKEEEVLAIEETRMDAAQRYLKARGFKVDKAFAAASVALDKLFGTQPLKPINDVYIPEKRFDSRYRFEENQKLANSMLVAVFKPVSTQWKINKNATKAGIIFDAARNELRIQVTQLAKVAWELEDSGWVGLSELFKVQNQPPRPIVSDAENEPRGRRHGFTEPRDPRPRRR